MRKVDKMSDLQQTSRGDIEIVNNTLVLVESEDEVKQRLAQRLRTFFGEWFLDNEIGLPYYENIFIKNPNAGLVEAIIKDEITDTPGVLELLSFDIEIDKATRHLTVDFMVRATTGNVEVEVTI